MTLDTLLTLIAIVTLWNGIVFCVYAFDKMAATQGAWRVREDTLILLAVGRMTSQQPGRDVIAAEQTGQTIQFDLNGRVLHANDNFLATMGYRIEEIRGRHHSMFVDPADVREDVTHAWLEPDAPRHPSEGDTQPVADKPGAYTWCKAPRWQGQVVECGALARQAVAGHPLDVLQGGGHARAEPAHGERRADDARVAHLGLDFEGFLHVAGHGRARAFQTDAAHGLTRQPQPVEHVEVLEERRLDVDGECVDHPAALGGGDLLLLVGQRRHVEELRNPLALFDFHEQHLATTGRQRQGQSGGHRRFAGATLARDEMEPGLGQAGGPADEMSAACCGRHECMLTNRHTRLSSNHE